MITKASLVILFFNSELKQSDVERSNIHTASWNIRLHHYNESFFQECLIAGS